MKLFLFRKRYLAIPGAILAAVALCLLTKLPSYVTTAAAQRQLPIYCVQRVSTLPRAVCSSART